MFDRYRFRSAAQALLQESMDQAIMEINNKMEGFVEGDYITVAQPPVGDFYFSPWFDHGVGNLCRIISISKGELPVRFDLDTSTWHGCTTFSPSIHSRLPSWVVEGIGGNRHGCQGDLCELRGGRHISLDTIVRKPYSAHIPGFEFLLRFDEYHSHKYVFSTHICHADKAMVKNVIEQRIKETEAARQEDIERKKGIEQEMRASEAISKSELDSLFHKMKSM